jgi:integrase
MLFHLIAYRGLRRGEGCGAGWDKINRRTRMLSVERQLGTNGWKVIEGAPKTKAGFRQVALDVESLDGLERHKRRQAQERLAAGDKWIESGFIFTEEDGSPLHPGTVTDLFQRLIKEIGLPPIRLHDLRHVAATLALAAGVDIKIVSEMLGHSTTAITRDIYQSVLDELFHAAAEAVVALVPRARRQAPKPTVDTSRAAL